jgi:hypothetical protein
MSNLLKLLIALAVLAFLSAIFATLLWPIFNVPAEAFSRASNNLSLIAIALMLAPKGASNSA